MLDPTIAFKLVMECAAPMSAVDLSSDRLSFVALIRQHTHLFDVREADDLSVQPACRDAKDDKFLALALVCEADAIISSDKDLLALNPWRSIPVLTPAGFIALNPSPASLGLPVITPR